MKSTGNPRPEGRQPSSGVDDAENRTKKTPSTDMQAEDAGTADSGNTANSGRGTATEGAMKQTSKTDAERGSKR